MSAKRILVIEDNPVNLELATDLLDTAGYGTLSADNAEEGIRTARAEMPDLVLMDIALPGMDGLTATGILKKDPQTRHLRIVALTAHAMKGDEEKALAMGCMGYITKPINTRSFARLVAEFLAIPAAAPVEATPILMESAHEVTEPTTAVAVDLSPAVATPSPLVKLELVTASPVAERPAVPAKPFVAEPSFVTEREFDRPVPPAIVEAPKPEMATPFLPVPRRGKGRRRREFAPLVPEVSTARILVVDDDELNREMITAQLTTLGYDSVVAEDGFHALDIVDESFDLVLLDYMMPGMDGCDTVKLLREEKMLIDLPVIMVTALSGREDQLRAIEMGANDWITKPVDRNELSVRVKSHLKFKATQDALKRHQRDLESAVRARTAELRKALEQVTMEQERTREAYLDTVSRLALAAEFRDGFMAAAHIKSVGNYCAAIARAMDLPDNTVELLLHASQIHDIGLLSVHEDVVRKGDRRADEEEAFYREHTALGARLLSGARSDMLRAGEVIALTHHEKWDGSGYPHGREGENIPLFGRICAVADTFDTITAYNGGEWQASNAEAREILTAGRGKDFDPQVIDAFFRCWDEILTIQRRFRRTETPPADMLPRILSRIAV
jgi:putative two-component system response regulator